MIVFSVNFDTQADALKQFNAVGQSTLIVFKGATEVGRSISQTSPTSIKELLDKAA